jgi:hypothetical protein
VTLDLLKQNAEDVHKVCEAAQLKRRHSDESVAIETFDPAVSGETLINIFFHHGLKPYHTQSNNTPKTPV